LSKFLEPFVSVGEITIFSSQSSILILKALTGFHFHSVSFFTTLITFQLTSPNFLSISLFQSTTFFVQKKGAVSVGQASDTKSI
jgi:hypothetical protein